MDINSALKDGYSKEEIAAELGRRTGMNYQQAMSDGHSLDDVLQEMSKRATTEQNPSYNGKVNAAPSTVGEGIVHGVKMLGLGTGQAVLQGGQWIRDALGMESNQPNVDRLQSIIDEEKKKFEGATTSAKIGNFVGGVAPTLVMPGAQGTLIPRILGNAAQGGVIGALQPTSGEESRLSNAATGAAFGGGATGVLAAAGKAAPVIGRTVKETLGASTGAGPGAVEEALRGSKSFVSALRGKITGEEVVDTAKTALNVIKDNRASAYQSQLAQITQNQQPINLSQMGQGFDKLLGKYGVTWKVDPISGTLKFDYSRVPMGHKGRKDIEEIVETLKNWGTKPGDDTAVGVDTLKRQLDDFYSDSSQARGFVAAVRKRVADTLESQVRGYKEMTRGYSEATKLIKDIESGLMMRKQGMTGRVTADQTLRRLTSAMRENFEMRRELVDALGNHGGANVAGEVAGYAMNQVIPRGLVGKLGGGTMATLSYLNPKMFPILAASSPRVVGEFLVAFGRAGRFTEPARKLAGKAVNATAPKAAAVLSTQEE